MRETSEQDTPDKRYWSDRLLGAKPLKNLPIKFDCSQAGLELCVNYALVQEVTSLLPEMLKKSSLRGDNVGLDEIDGVHFEYVTEMAEIFAVRRLNATAISNADSDDVAAFIIIALSVHSRSFDSCLADVRVVRASYVSDDVYINVTKMALELTKQLDCGFTDCLLPVAKSCDQLAQALAGQLGFRVAVTLPLCVYMAGDVGLTDSLLMTYNLADAANRPQRPRAEVIAYVAKFGIADGPDDDAKYNNLTLPKFPFLPVQYRFEKSGILANLRNMERNEDRIVFELLEATARRGEGFDMNDILNIATVRQIYLVDYPTMIIEDIERKSIIGWMNICPCWFARSPQAKYGEGCLVIAKEYQNRYLGSELTSLVLGLAKQLDYKWIVLDHFSNNTRSNKTNKRVATTEVGVIPRCGYLVGNGWTDVIVTCKDVSMNSQPTFLEMVEFNRKKHISNDPHSLLTSKI